MPALRNGVDHVAHVDFLFWQHMPLGNVGNMWGICGEYAGSMTLSELFLFMCHNEKKVMCLQCLSILSIVTMLANMVGLS